MIRLFLFVCLCPLILISQDLENTIYAEVDQLSQQPSIALLGNLESKVNQFSKQVSTSNEQMALVVLQCQMGYQFSRFNSAQKAITYYENAWSLYEAENLSGYDMIDYGLKPLGNLYTKTGDYNLAEQTIKRYIALAETAGKTIQKTRGLLNLAIVYHSVGNFKTAIEVLQMALKTNNLPANLKAQLQNNLANSLIAKKDFDAAESLLNKTNSSLASLLTKAQLAKNDNRLEVALQLLEDAEQFLKDSEDFSARDFAKLYVQKADVFLLKNEADSVKLQFEKAFQTLSPLAQLKTLSTTDLYPENTFLAIFDGLARIKTNTEQALLYYDWSFYVSKLLQDNLSDQQSQLILDAENRQRSERCIALLYEIYEQTKGVENIQLALNYAEQTKSRLLQSQVNAKSLLKQHPNDKLLLKRQNLQQTQEALISDLIKSQYQLNNRNLDSLQSKLRNVSVELKSVAKIITSEFSESESSLPSIEAIQQRLRHDNAILLEFFYGKEAIYLFKIEANAQHFFKIQTNAEFTDIIKSFLTFFEAPSNISQDVSAYTKTASKLFKLLKLPKTKEQSKWIIIPDGLLNFVSFDALLTQDTNTFQFQQMPFLVRDATLFYQNSASFYLNEVDLDKQNTKILGVFPVFSNTSEELQYSLEEAKTVRAFNDSFLLLNEEATKENFVKRAANYEILHLSTHATGGSLSMPAQLAFYDEPLLLNELYSLDLNTNLVVLSACETAIGRLQLGEGAMSLSRGFQYAGANQLLVTQWQVNDKSTADVVQSFYQFYNDGYSVGHATQRAKLDYLNNSEFNNASKSPYYWASFMAISNQLQDDTSNFNYLYLVLLLIVLLGIGLVFRRKTKRS